MSLISRHLDDFEFFMQLAKFESVKNLNRLTHDSSFNNKDKETGKSPRIRSFFSEEFRV